jgi:branched-subunit amino acid transport protein
MLLEYVAPVMLGALIGPSIWIELASDMLIFRHPYRYSDMERDLI